MDKSYRIITTTLAQVGFDDSYLIKLGLEDEHIEEKKIILFQLLFGVVPMLEI